MKSKFIRPATILSGAMLTLSFASAASVYWDGGTGSWNTNSNWSLDGGATTPDPVTVPGSADDLIFNIAGSNMSQTIALDSDQAAKSLTHNNTGNTVIVSGGTPKILTLGSGGITLSSGAGVFTFGDGTTDNDVLINLPRGSQTWTNQSSNHLTINNTVAAFSRVSGATLSFNAAVSSFAMSETVLPNDASGIVGSWAFFGTGSGARYAFNNAGTLAAYTGGTAAADVNAFTSATVNYDFSTSGTTNLGGSRTANTIRYTGSGNTIDLGSSGSNTLTLNGILAVGASGTLTIQRTGGTGTLTSGSSNELVIAGTQNVTISAPISGTGRTLTYAGTGTLTLNGTNTFSGSLNVNSGILSSSNTTLQALTTYIGAGATYNGSYGFGTNPSYTAPWTVNGTFNKTGNGSITFGSGAPISGTGTINLGLGGQITVVVSSNNSGFTGTISENTQAGGGVILGNNNALGAGTWVFGNNTNPYSSSIANFANPNATALVFSGDRTFSGSNNMNLGSGAVTLDGANRTLTVTGITLTLGGAIGQDVAGRQLTKAGTGTLVLGGSLNYTGNTTLSAGNLTLTGTSGSYNGTLLVNAGNFNLGGGTATGSLGASPTLTLGGGTFSYTRTGTNTQNFATTNFNSTPANVLSVSAGNTLNLGNIVRAAGIYYDFSNAGAGLVGANTSNNSALGIMSTYFTYGNSWAVADPAGITAYSAYALSSVAGTTAGDYTGQHIDINASAGTLDDAITANSVRFSAAAANTLALTGANVISSGGILVASAVGANLSTIAGGTSLTGASNGAIVIQQNNVLGGLAIESNIINSGTTTLDKIGAGTLLLSGTNTYTGATTIYQGTLAVSGGAAIANNGLVALTNTAGAAFRLDGNETIGNLSGGGTAGGTVALQGNTLTLGDANAQTYGGNFTGTGASGLIKQGTAALTMSNATSIPGTLRINAGSTVFSTGNLSGGTITLNGSPSSIATLDLRFSSAVVPVKGPSGLGGGLITNSIVLGSSVTTTGARLFASTGDGSWNFTGGITGAASATQTLVLDTRSGGTTGGDRATTTISGVIANGAGGALGLSFNITPQTSSTASNNHPTYVNLTGINTFTGTITATRTNAGATSWLTIGGEHWANGSFGNNTPTYGREGTGYLAGSGNDGNFTSAINFGSTAGQIVNLSYFSSANQTLSGVIGGGSNNNGALVKEGTGTLTLTAANGYNRLTTIGGGTLALAFNTGVTTNNILPSTTPLWMGLGTSYNSDSNTANAALVFFGGGGGGTLRLAGTAASATQTVASLNTAVNTASRIIMGAGRTLTFTSGTIGIGANSGLNFNTAAGGNSGSSVGSSIITFGGTPTAFTNGFTVTDTGGFGLATVNGSNQVIRDTTTLALIASGASSGTNYRTTSGSGNSVTSSQATGSITTDTTDGAVTLTLDTGVTLSNNVWNFGGNGSNTAQVTGGTGINAVASNNTIVINNFNAGAVTFNSPILANGANALVVGGTGTVTLNGLNTFTGNTTISGGNLQIGSSGRLVGGTYAGTIGINAGSVFQYSGSNAQTLSGIISGPGGITKDTNASVLTLSATNVHTGPTTINAGTLRAGAAAGGQAFGAGSAVTIANTAGATLDLNSFSQTIGSLAGGGSTGGNITLGSATLTTGGNHASTNFGGSISGTGGIIKNGLGTFTLSGSSNYSGPTTVNRGTLALAGASVTSPITIASGASLGFAIGSPASSTTSTVNLTNGTVKIIGAPSLASHTLLETGGIVGTPVLDSPIEGYTLVVEGNTLKLNSTGGDITLPTLASMLDNASGGPVNIGDTVTYSVTFSEDMDHTTVTAADFSNNGTAPSSIGTVTETSPGVFSVPVTVTGPGTLVLRINASAVIKDLAGNNLDTTSALLDDTTITVRNAYQTWKQTNAPTGGVSDDFDTDGVSNAVEFVLGGSNGSNDQGRLPAISTPDGNMVFTFQRKRSSIDGVTGLVIEVGTTLGSWPNTYNVGTTSETSTPGVSVIGNTPSGFDTITLTLPRGTDERKFARLKVSVAP